jgi:hypothetical protein
MILKSLEGSIHVVLILAGGSVYFSAWSEFPDKIKSFLFLQTNVDVGEGGQAAFN